MHQTDEDPAAGGADGMAKGDGAAVNVDLLAVPFEQLADGQRLDGKIVITGVTYGNAAICVQPKRGCAGPRCDGRVCKILHDPDIPPPHQYLADSTILVGEDGKA